MLDPNNKTHFGYREVPTNEKVGLVKNVFDSVANKYDLMNDFMSFGMHRLWKQSLINEAGVRSGQFILDVASGTGDLAKSFAKSIGVNGRVILTDINENMLRRGRDRLVDAGIISNVIYIQADAEKLPFHDNYFDCITIAFGLRNVTDKSAALRSMYRILKPGGKLLILEFSHPSSDILKKLYDLYSFKIIPTLGEFIANDSTSYEYLVESIRMHPDQETLKQMMIEEGFEDVAYTNLTGGIVAIHKGYKY